MKNRRFLSVFGISLLAGIVITGVLLSSLVPETANAKKPPKPPPPPGFIFFDINNDLYKMRGDGSEKTLVLAEFFVDRLNKYTSPSQFLHGGMRWFLQFQEVEDEFDTYPDGEAKVELFAISENGDFVQLSDSSVQPPWYGRPEHDFQWAAGDTVVSWLGRRWAPDGTIQDLGIYYVVLDADVAGGPTPATPVRIPIQDYPTSDYPQPGPWPAGTGFGWSPDGLEVAFGDWDSATGQGGLLVADVSTGAVIQLSFTASSHPTWSPDGTRIAFEQYPDEQYPDGIDIINTDGTGQVRLVTNTTTRTYSYWNRIPSWSPDGNYLCYQKLSSHRKKNFNPEDVYRISAEGGDETNLTGDIHSSLYFTPMGWVE